MHDHATFFIYCRLLGDWKVQRNRGWRGWAPLVSPELGCYLEMDGDVVSMYVCMYGGGKVGREMGKRVHGSLSKVEKDVR